MQEKSARWTSDHPTSPDEKRTPRRLAFLGQNRAIGSKHRVEREYRGPGRSGVFASGTYDDLRHNQPIRNDFGKATRDHRNRRIENCTGKDSVNDYGININDRDRADNGLSQRISTILLPFAKIALGIRIQVFEVFDPCGFNTVDSQRSSYLKESKHHLLTSRSCADHSTPGV